MRRTRIADIEEWLNRLSLLVEQGQCASPTFLKPYHFATLALHLTRHGKQALKIPTFLEVYAARMNLWGVLGQQPPREINKGDASGKFLPLEAIRTSSMVSDNALKIREIAQAQYHGYQTFDALEEVMGEIMGNSFAHAKISPSLPSFACAQSWPQGSLAQICVADAGIGIRASLMENLALVSRLETENACLLATERYLTSKPNVHSGYGLALARDLIEQNRGNLVVVSGDEAFRSDCGKVTTVKMSLSWPGTLVVFEWDTTRVLDSLYVYDQWTKDELAKNERV